MSERTYYRCIVADPPWSYDNKMEQMQTTGDGAAGHYDCMSVEEIADFYWKPVQIHREGQATREETFCDTLEDCGHLWLWITNAHLVGGAHVPVLKTWGFTAKTIVTWVKGRLGLRDIPGSVAPALVPHIGQGYYLRNNTEHCIFAIRSKQAPLVRNLPTAFIHPARWEGREHSEKPSIIHEWAETLSLGPRLEVFARRRRSGWDAIGDEL